MPERLGAVHWLARAEEVRMLAESISDENTRCEMLRIAAGYEKLAAQAIRRAAGEVMLRPLADPCRRNIEKTPLCKVEVTLPACSGMRHDGGA